LLQIWEFGTNTLEMIKAFKIEELYMSLKYTGEEEVTLITEFM
jgi:hypothetical protein